MVIVRFVEPGRWDLSSRLIAWFTQGRYSHVEFITRDGKALGARLKGGVKYRPFGYIGNRRSRIFTIDAPEHQVYEYAKSQLGKPYDWLAILGFITGRSWQNSRRWFCSEYVTWSVLRADVEILRVEEVSKITPDGLSLSPLLKRLSAYEVRDLIESFGDN